MNNEKLKNYVERVLKDSKGRKLTAEQIASRIKTLLWRDVFETSKTYDVRYETIKNVCMELVNEGKIKHNTKEQKLDVFSI